MIDWVIDALNASTNVDRIFVAVSKNTPKTASRMRKKGIEVVETPGDGFVADMAHAIGKLRLGKTLVVAADLPLISGSLVDRVILAYDRSKKPALSVMCPVELYLAYGLRPEFRYEVGEREVAPAGLNVIDGNMIGRGTLDEERLVLEDRELLFNINSDQDVRIAERMKERLKGETGRKSK